MHKEMPQQMVALRHELDGLGVKWEDATESYFFIMDGWDCIYRTHWEYNNHRYSAICGVGTYGAAFGLLELMVDDEEPIGHLHSNEVVGIMLKTKVVME